MSGLLEKIVQRRRATAARRLGPPAQNGAAAPAETWAHTDELTLDPLPPRPPEPPTREPAEPRRAPEPPAATHDDSARAERPQVPPPIARPEPLPPSRPASARQRAQMRRRARFLRALRELQLRDIGGFLIELHRFGRQRPDLVEAKVKEAAATDHELRALERALGEHRGPDEVREPGVGGACPDCGTVHGSTDRFCSWCGRAL